MIHNSKLYISVNFKKFCDYLTFSSYVKERNALKNTIITFENSHPSFRYFQ